MVFFFFFFFFFEGFFYEVGERVGVDDGKEGRKERKDGRKEKKGGGMVALLSRHNKSEVKFNDWPAYCSSFLVDLLSPISGR